VTDLDALLADVRACRLCADHLPLGPRPVVQLDAAAPILIIGQAPGTKVHATGVPFNDPSGDRLREWLGVDRATFYDPGKVALMPMGLCYPGRAPNGSDLPPRRECAPHWHPRLRPRLARVRLTLLVGQYAQAHYLGRARKRTLGETVQAWQDYLPDYWPTPHPSWRVNHWLNQNPWYAAEVLPALRAQVSALLKEAP
jgi:uracil-DNA glycosylase